MTVLHDLVLAILSGAVVIVAWAVLRVMLGAG